MVRIGRENRLQNCYMELFHHDRFIVCGAVQKPMAHIGCLCYVSLCLASLVQFCFDLGTSPCSIRPLLLAIATCLLFCDSGVLGAFA